MKAITEEEMKILGEGRKLIAAYDDASAMIQTGLYAAGSDPAIDAAIDAWPRLDAFVSEKSENCEESFGKLSEAITPSGDAPRKASAVA